MILLEGLYFGDFHLIIGKPEIRFIIMTDALCVHHVSHLLWAERLSFEEWKPETSNRMFFLLFPTILSQPSFHARMMVRDKQWLWRATGESVWSNFARTTRLIFYVFTFFRVRCRWFARATRGRRLTGRCLRSRGCL